MSLYKFKSKAAGDVIMLSAHAHQLFDAAGLELPERGVIEPKDMARVHANLVAAINMERMAKEPPEKDEADMTAQEKAALINQVSLEQRAYPFMKMLEAAQAKDKDIHWGF